MILAKLVVLAIFHFFRLKNKSKVFIFDIHQYCSLKVNFGTNLYIKQQICK